MSGSSDEYLEKALSEYNAKVNGLEPAGDSEDLLEAYVNRGCILSMMEHYTSALDDLQAASEIESRIGSDDGTYVKMKTELGKLYSHFGTDPQEIYSDASARLRWIHPSSRHFDAKKIVGMCLESADILLEFSHTQDCIPYLDKALESTGSKIDPWMRNRRMEAFNLLGEVYDTEDNAEKAAECYTESADIGLDLMGSGKLEDIELLAATFMARAECNLDLGLMDRFVEDSDRAVTMIEKMHDDGKLEDLKEASEICNNVASEFIKQGRIKEAEAYLMKAVKLTLKGAQDYIDRQEKTDSDAL